MAGSSPSPLMSGSGATMAGAKNLQERLHQLLTRLASTVELIKTWPESDGDDASIHVETTTKLIAAILEVIVSLQRVEGVVKADSKLRKSLQDCPVPINLLDLLDHGNGLNPDCFSRGLLKEARGQLAGLKRRKLALEMLGRAVQTGLKKRLAESSSTTTSSSTSGGKSSGSKKRSRDSSDRSAGSSSSKRREDGEGERTKKTKLDDTTKISS